MLPADVDAADANLRQRVDKRIINNNESLLKIDCALAEPLRFEHHNHQDNYLIGSVLIADSVEQVETAHHEAARGRIPDHESVDVRRSAYGAGPLHGS